MTSLWLFLVRYLLRSYRGSLPCILRILLFLASFGSVLAFSLVTSFVTRSNFSSFATGSSLRAESPLSVVSYLLSHGFSSCPLVFGILPLLDSVLSFLLLFVVWVPFCFVGSSLGFLYLSSLPVGVSRLHLFCFSYSFLRLSPLTNFSHSSAVAVVLSISFNFL